MSTRTCSKKAQKVVSLAKQPGQKRIPSKQVSHVSSRESQTQNGGQPEMPRLRPKRPAEPNVSIQKKLRQEPLPPPNLADDLSLDFILSDEETPEPKRLDDQVDSSKRLSPPIQINPDSARSCRGTSTCHPLRVSTRGKTSTQRQKQLESLPFLRGFKNLGNTCYMNAVLQALLSLSPFQSDIHRFWSFYSMMGSQSEESPDQSEIPDLSIDKISPGLIAAFIDIMGQVNTESNSINGFPLKMAVGQQEKRFADFRQQDAHEFFLCLLDKISDEVVETMKAANKLSGEKHEYKDFCPTTKNFDCLVEHSLTCTNCSDTTRVTELYRDFSLEIPANFNEPQFAEFKPSLQNLTQAFFSTDEVDRRCEKCGGGRAYVSHQILQLPRILVLHLKRFRLDFKRSTYTKITRKVFINPELDLSFFCSSRVQSPPSSPSFPNSEESSDNSSVVFDLHCITHHIGRYATAGHYISDVRVSSRGEDQRWYSYNDTIVTEISKDEALNEERESYGYMFFYLLRTN